MTDGKEEIVQRLHEELLREIAAGEIGPMTDQEIQACIDLWRRQMERPQSGFDWRGGREDYGEWLLSEYRDSRGMGQKHPEVESFIQRNHGITAED